jgi:hypothetical protein
MLGDLLATPLAGADRFGSGLVPPQYYEHPSEGQNPLYSGFARVGRTGLEPVTSGLSSRRSPS